jgi:hypothetical protein
MAEVVNLRQARKAKKRADDRSAAAVNRAAFGRTKAEKAKEKAEAARAAGVLDGARRAPGTSGDDPPA